MAVLIGLIASCSKKDEPLNPSETKTTIGEETFEPTNIVVSNNGKNLELSFTEGEKTVIIKTSDTVVGTYQITTTLLKKASLEANLTYNDGTKIYTATSGTVEINAYSGGAVSGTYSATVTSADNQSLEITAGVYAQVDVEHPSIFLQTLEEINTELTDCYSGLNSYVELLYLFDAIYSNKVSSPGSSWDNIYSHSQDATNEKVRLMWTKAWDLIYQCNLIIESSNELTVDDATAINNILGQVKAIRAYAFYNLLTWFKDVPLDLEVTKSLIGRSTEAEVLAQIVTDASEAVSLLPVSWSGNDAFRLEQAFAKSILVRVYLYKGEYQNASNTSEEIINSGNYALDIDPENFTAGNAENYYGFAKGANTEFNTFFTKGTFIPVIRYTETVLSAAEAMYGCANTAAALEKINIFKARRGESNLFEITPDAILEQWDTEHTLEGTSFSNLKRFNRAITTLEIPEFKLIIPIPQAELEANQNLTQNPGY